MVTETRATEFETFLRRRAPDWLRQPPTSVPSDVLEQARQHERQLLAHEYVQALSQGWTPQELAQGSLAQGAAVTPAGDVVRRRAAYDVPTMEKASRLLHEVAARGAKMDRLSKLDLERVAAGLEVNEGRETTLFAEAQAALAERDREEAAAKEEQAPKIVLTVLKWCKDTWSGKVYVPGPPYEITEEEAQSLRGHEQAFGPLPIRIEQPEATS